MKWWERLFIVLALLVVMVIVLGLLLSLPKP
jgi:hypothetical protein